MENSHRFENLTWPEVNDAVEKGLIPVLPVGTGRAARSTPADQDGLVDSRFGGQRGRAAQPRPATGDARNPVRLHDARDGLPGQRYGPPRDVHAVRRRRH